MNFALKVFLILVSRTTFFSGPRLSIFPKMLTAYNYHIFLIIFLSSSVSDASFTKAFITKSSILPTLLFKHLALA